MNKGLVTKRVRDPWFKNAYVRTSFSLYLTLTGTTQRYTFASESVAFETVESTIVFSGGLSVLRLLTSGAVLLETGDLFLIKCSSV